MDESLSRFGVGHPGGAPFVLGVAVALIASGMESLIRVDPGRRWLLTGRQSGHSS